jgi:hypothetical protein
LGYRNTTSAMFSIGKKIDLLTDNLSASTLAASVACSTNFEATPHLYLINPKLPTMKITAYSSS